MWRDGRLELLRKRETSKPRVTGFDRKPQESFVAFSIINPCMEPWAAYLECDFVHAQSANRRWSLLLYRLFVEIKCQEPKCQEAGPKISLKHLPPCLKRILIGGGMERIGRWAGREFWGCNSYS